MREKKRERERQRERHTHTLTHTHTHTHTQTEEEYYKFALVCFVLVNVHARVLVTRPMESRITFTGFESMADDKKNTARI